MTKVGLWFTVTALFLAGGGTASAQRAPSRSPHGPLNIPCENCHTATSWTPIRAIPEFNHNSTRYPLRGMHEKVSCTGCHLKPVFTDVGHNCADCHADIHRAQFGSNCAQCHTPNGWQVSVQSIQNHFNRFPLLGAHAVVECDQCHKSAAVGNYVGLSTACESCHLADYQRTTNPPHKAAGFETTCQDCHKSFDNWLSASFGVNGTFDHSKFGFPLTLGHAGVACETCHIGGNYNLTTQLQSCGDSNCHLKTWQQTNNPAHAANATWFPVAQCSTCHPTWDSWNNSQGFNHTVTGFPLTQGHANVACTACHGASNYALTTTLQQCGDSNCHLTRWNQTTTPIHSQSGPAFQAQNCANCHTPAGWTAAAFDHSVTGFALVGTHLSTPCASCHTGSNPYGLTNADCYTSNCHLNNYNTTTSPNHAAVGYSTATAQCAACHPITTWAQGTFNHPAAFPLTQGHAGVACALCHIGNNYALTTLLSSCGDTSCHLTRWQQTMTPPHMANATAFPIANCSTCHTPAGWTGATFNHATVNFVLTGLHVSPNPTPCASCHNGAAPYSLSSTACYNCHVDVWTKTTTGVYGPTVPNHITSNFPQDCSICHGTSNWTTAIFNHNNVTPPFPLTGAHLTTVTCGQCHVGPTGYSGNLPTACDGCHDPLYLSTATTVYVPPAPNHVASGYPKTCDSCHTTTDWTSAVFNHAATPFGALTGGHAGIACTLCHTSATPPPLDCYSCHTVAWQSTTSLATGSKIPNHLAADAAAIGITHDCKVCHTPLAPYWQGATMAHPFFNINHGNSGGICSNCHTSVTTTYTAYQCTGCHGGDNPANFSHPSVGGRYVYLSSACYSCHRGG